MRILKLRKANMFVPSVQENSQGEIEKFNTVFCIVTGMMAYSNMQMAIRRLIHEFFRGGGVAVKRTKKVTILRAINYKYYLSLCCR